MKIRQKIRLGIIFISFFLFPATFYYLSPYLVIEATTKGVVNGSFIIFLFLFISSLVLGRGFCGWLCPASGCQEVVSQVRSKKVTKGNYVKWILWTPWIGSIILLLYNLGGYREIDLFYQTSHGLSIGNIYSLLTYILVLLLIVIPAFLIGRRSFCHHICWMAPFMIIGRSLRNIARWPSLHLIAKSDVCVRCSKCTDNCPMSLPVETMVQNNVMENHECILCGTCIDNCEQKTIHYSFKQDLINLN